MIPGSKQKVQQVDEVQWCIFTTLTSARQDDKTNMLSSRCCFFFLNKWNMSKWIIFVRDLSCMARIHQPTIWSMITAYNIGLHKDRPCWVPSFEPKPSRGILPEGVAEFPQKRKLIHSFWCHCRVTLHISRCKRGSGGLYILRLTFSFITK